MVKSGTDRAKHYANVLNGNIPYLTTKAILRNGKVDVAKISAIAALKDSDGKAIIDSFGLASWQRQVTLLQVGGGNFLK